MATEESDIGKRKTSTKWQNWRDELGAMPARTAVERLVEEVETTLKALPAEVRLTDPKLALLASYLRRKDLQQILTLGRNPGFHRYPLLHHTVRRFDPEVVRQAAFHEANPETSWPMEPKPEIEPSDARPTIHVPGLNEAWYVYMSVAGLFERPSANVAVAGFAARGPMEGNDGVRVRVNEVLGKQRLRRFRSPVPRQYHPAAMVAEWARLTEVEKNQHDEDLRNRLTGLITHVSVPVPLRLHQLDELSSAIKRDGAEGRMLEVLRSWEEDLGANLGAWIKKADGNLILFGAAGVPDQEDAAFEVACDPDLAHPPTRYLRVLSAAFSRLVALLRGRSVEHRLSVPVVCQCELPETVHPYVRAAARRRLQDALKFEIAAPEDLDTVRLELYAATPTQYPQRPDDGILIARQVAYQVLQRVHLNPSSWGEMDVGLRHWCKLSSKSPSPICAPARIAPECPVPTIAAVGIPEESVREAANDERLWKPPGKRGGWVPPSSAGWKREQAQSWVDMINATPPRDPSVRPSVLVQALCTPPNDSEWIATFSPLRWSLESFCEYPIQSPGLGRTLRIDPPWRTRVIDGTMLQLWRRCPIPVAVAGDDAATTRLALALLARNWESEAVGAGMVKAGLEEVPAPLIQVWGSLYENAAPGERMSLDEAWSQILDLWITREPLRRILLRQGVINVEDPPEKVRESLCRVAHWQKRLRGGLLQEAEAMLDRKDLSADEYAMVTRALGALVRAKPW